MSELILRIPLEAVPQRFAIELSGVSLIMACRWNPELPAWTLDVYDGETSAPLAMGLPIVTGVDLLGQHRHLGIPGQLLVHVEGADEAAPTLDNLGSLADVYYYVPA